MCHQSSPSFGKWHETVWKSGWNHHAVIWIKISRCLIESLTGLKYICLFYSLPNNCRMWEHNTMRKLLAFVLLSVGGVIAYLFISSRIARSVGLFFYWENCFGHYPTHHWKRWIGMLTTNTSVVAFVSSAWVSYNFCLVTIYTKTLSQTSVDLELPHVLREETRVPRGNPSSTGRTFKHHTQGGSRN